MKVLHIKCSSGFWGPDQQVLQLARLLHEAGISVEILLLYRRGPDMPATHPLVARARHFGIEATQYPDRNSVAIGALMRIRQCLSTRGVAVIHTHDYKSNLLGVLSSAGLGIHHIASVRGYTRRTFALRIYEFVDLHILRFISQIATVSNHMRRQLIAAGLEADRIETIYNAIDVDAFAASVTCGELTAMRHEAGLSDSNFVVTIVARLSSEKGHEDFLEAASKVQQAIPASRFLVVGEGPLAANLRRQTCSLGLEGIVAFLGYREDVANIMTASDVVVLASRREGLPNVLLEALSLGKPVIATGVGGVPEIIRNGHTGLLVPPQDSGALAQAVIRLHHDRDLAEGLGSRGRQLVTRCFSTEVVAQQWVELYHRSLDGCPA